jgi:hypothetical protein
MIALPPRAASLVRWLTGLDLSSPRAWWETPAKPEPDGSGPRANRRVTALTGLLVLPLAALVLLTGLLFGSLWHVHYFLAFLLLPLVLLKVGSTTYRMVRYYLRSGLYRFIRPPYPLARVTSPLLVVSVVLLFVSGIAMWATHSRRDPWGWLHTDAAIAFSCLVALHLGMYVPEALRAAGDDLKSEPVASAPHRRDRLAVIGVAAAAGLVLAVATIGFSQFPARAHRERHAQATTPGAAADPTTTSGRR